MYAIEVFLIKIILHCYFLKTVAVGTGYSFETTCVCTQASPNGTFCWAYKCRSDQITTCFSSHSTVEIKLTKERISMNNLKIGDEILVDINNYNQRIYEPIYSFIHASPNGLYDYLKISVENISEQSLIISSNHLIYRINEKNPIFAGHLKIGDQLQVITKDGYKQAGSIINIQLIKSQGFYAPLTLSGKLVVDGIVVSNYATVANHHLAHLSMQPYRWWIQWIGLSSYSDSIHWYCQWLYHIVEQINKWIFSIELYDGYFTVSNF
ncbi:unnamed protein product [Rotaria sp. Silwood1]|nr:unnamed protein product [Rotaria sp. Silwood1]